jgi:O-antigen/teichoic acid export membrane protein
VPVIPVWLRPKPTPEWSQIVLLGATGIRMMLSLGLTILVGRFLSPREFGGFALVATVFGLAHEFTDMGTGNVAVRAAARSRDNERTILEQLLGLRLMLSLVAALACAGFALAQTDSMLRGMLLATSVVLIFSYVSACSAVFQLRQAQVPPSVLSVLVQIATLMTAAILVAIPVGGGWLPGVIVARELLVVVGTLALGIRVVGYTPWPRFSGTALRSFFGAAAVVALATLAYHFQLQGGLFWVQVMRPEAELGAFAAAQRPLTPLLFIPWVVMLPLVPLLSWLVVHDPAAFRRQGQGAIDLSIGLGAVMAVVTLLLAEPVLAFLYGERFSTGPLSATTTLRWLALSLGCSFVVAALSTVLVAAHREWALLRLSASGLVLYAAGNLLLVSGMGFNGSAIATALSLGVMTIGGLALIGWMGVLPGLRTVLILLPAAVLFPLLELLPGPPFVTLALATPLTCIALAAVWKFPGLAANRAEQVTLTRQALAGHG